MRASHRVGRRAPVTVPFTVLCCWLAVSLAACTSAPEPGPGSRTAGTAGTELRLDASVAQFRFLEGTRNLRAGITNNGDRDIRVTSVTIAWDGLDFPTITLPEAPTPPGQTAALTIAYGAPHCGAAPSGRPTMVAVIDGRSRRLPLRVEDPGLLDRLRSKACADRRLARAADVSLRWGRRPERVDGELWLPGTLDVAHHPGQPEVTVVDLAGSVLLEVRTRTKALLPVGTADGRLGSALPVLVGSTHRCDPHALSQSSQTFLLSAYLRVDGRPTQRVILVPTKSEQLRMMALLHRVCGTP